MYQHVIFLDFKKGTSKDRYVIAKYCMMDVILCIEIMNELQILTSILVWLM